MSDLDLDLDAKEEERGFVNLILLPEQAAIINQFLATRGFMISPPHEFGGEPQRILTFADPPPGVAHEH